MAVFRNTFSEMIELAENIEEGLSAEVKYISSKFFYDKKGSDIFKEIMRMPEYYLTDSEVQIFSTQTKAICEAFQYESTFDIVELGPGDGLKSTFLLQHLVEQGASFKYIPVDISEDSNTALEQELKTKIPGLKVKAVAGDYFEVLRQIPNGAPRLILFLGANIGNYNEEGRKEFLSLLHTAMRPGDQALIGFDLKKNPIIIKNAYDDPHGITKRFNLNLLTRFNREFEANFMLDQFDFYSNYDPISGDLRSYLISIKKQDVLFKKTGKIYHFELDELIYTELSKKYSIKEIETIAVEHDFEVREHFLDCRHYFTDSLWVKN